MHTFGARRFPNESKHLLFFEHRPFSANHVNRLAYARELNIGHVLPQRDELDDRRRPIETVKRGICKNDCRYQNICRWPIGVVSKAFKAN